MSVKCANCDNPAAYTDADAGANSVSYCAVCLPSWLKTRAILGQFPLIEE